MRFIFLLLCFGIYIKGFSQERFLTIDGSKIWVNSIGLENRKLGQPVVVFESGLGTPMDNWDRVFKGASELAPVVAYDRPGIGKSEPVDETPTIKNVSERLLKLLNQLNVEPPYLLVGHSLGGMYVRGFAVYHPEVLAGLVIIDPADFTENHQNIKDYYDVLNWEAAKIDSLIQSFIDRRVTRSSQAPGPIQREGQVLEDIREKEFSEIAESKLPNIPIHIITGGRFDMPQQYRSKEYDDEALFRSKIKHRLLRWTDVVQSVDKGMLFYSGDAGHFVQYDDPELVLSSIRIALQDYELVNTDKKKK